MRVEEGDESADELQKSTNVRTEGALSDDEAAEMLGSNIYDKGSVGGGGKKQAAKKKKHSPNPPHGITRGDWSEATDGYKRRTPC